MSATVPEEPANRKPPPRPMQRALALAAEAAAAGEIPVGAVVVDADGQTVAEARNETLARNDATAHAELLAIQRAGVRLGSQRLAACDLYVTLEPCTMCAAAISFARLRRLYFGAADSKGGAVESGVRFFHAATCHHVPEVYGGIGEAAAAALLKAFFAARR